MASTNQVFDLTSSRIPGFFLGIVRKSVGEKVGPAGGYGIKAEWMPNLDGVSGAGSVTTGDVFDFRSIVPSIFLWQKTSFKTMQAVGNGLSNSALKLFHTLLTNPFVNEKPLLQSNLITAARRTVHQAKEPWKLTITRQ